MKFYNNEKNFNNYIEYFSIKSINHKIILNKKNPLINNIISDNYYVNFDDFKLQNNKIKIKYCLEFKILYLSLENNKTYTLKDIKVGYIEIVLPNKINGESLESIFLRNGFIMNLKVLNSSILSYKPDYISIYLNLLSYLEVLKIHSLVYKIKFSNFEENIYTSFLNGQDLTQKTFNINKTFSNLRFSKKDNFIFYLEQSNFISSINKFSLENEDNFTIYKNLNLKNYEIFDDKNLLLIIENINDVSLILFNIETSKETIFYDLSYFKIKFFKVSKNIIILILIDDNKKYLSLLNKTGELLCKIEGNFFYVDISPCESFLLLMEKNVLKLLFLNSKEIYALNKDLIIGNIKSFKFLNSKKVLIHINHIEKDYLIILNLSNNKKETLIETPYKIIDFSIDSEKSIIYYTLKTSDTSIVYTINQKKEIKNILNLDAKSISLIARS